MPNTDFTTKLLELEDVIISDLQTTNTEVYGQENFPSLSETSVSLSKL